MPLNIKNCFSITMRVLQKFKSNVCINTNVTKTRPSTIRVNFQYNTSLNLSRSFRDEIFGLTDENTQFPNVFNLLYKTPTILF